MSNAEQLERETEQARSHIAETLLELRASVTPGRVFNQIADRFGDGGGAALVANLKRQTIDNPVPVALVGAGLAWLMLGGRSGADGHAGFSGDAARQRVSEAADKATDLASGLASDLRERAESAMEGAKQSTSEAGEGLSHTASSLREQVRENASAGYETVSDSARRAASAASSSARAAGQRTFEAGNALVDFCRSQPVVLAGLGVVIGATLGALLPLTDTEDRLMGETSDELKAQAQHVASEQYDAAKKVAERGLDAAQDEASRQADEQEQSMLAEGRIADADDASLIPSQPDGHATEGGSGAEDRRR